MLDPVIKVRHKVVLTILAVVTVVHGLPKCDKTPIEEQGIDKTPGNNGFAVDVIGSPRLYRPNQIYTITLSGIQEDQIAKFQDFMLVAEHMNPGPGSMDPASLGTFQLMPGDAMTKFSHKCSHSIEATSSISKEYVEAYWTAPERGSGCIQFKAMVVERQEVWYMDDGALTYTLCEDDSPLAEPPVVEDCCACNEAKYEVIFEGIWSRHTHPKDFPKDEWRTQFSKIIGASHSKDYTLWEYGRMSSPALDVLGRYGLPYKLEGQMKKFSNNIRSVIKAHGLKQRSNVAGQTFAVFRVDKKHHLLSLVSKMIPSPDWIVGTSKENLCLANCTWVENRVIDLYPWDIGIESGLRYDSPMEPTNPKGQIQRITSSNPDDSESPFWDETSAPMKPAARLHIIKQREYRAACPKSPMGRAQPGQPGGPGGAGDGLNPSLYAPPDYGEESSYTYGVGIGQPVDGEGGMDGTDYEEYRATDSTNPYGGGGYGGGQFQGGNDYDYDAGGTDYGQPDYRGGGGACATTSWSGWSQCSSSCGSGSRSKRRQYEDPGLAQINGCREELFYKEPCRNLPKCEPKSYMGSFNPFPADQNQMGFPGYSTPWLERGLESEGLKAGNSYIYGTEGTNEKFTDQEGPEREAEMGTTARSFPRFGRQRDPVTGGGVDPGPYGNSYIYGGTTLDGEPDVPRHSSYRGQPQSDSTDDDCTLTEWGDWSDCSSLCDRGFRTRKRMYVNADRSSSCSEELNDRESCRGSGPNCMEPVASLGFNYVKPHYREGDPECAVSEWSNWSPCSNPCGPGQKLRTRLYLVPFLEDRSCDIKLFHKESCYGQDAFCSSGFVGDYASVSYDQNDYNNDQDYDIVSDISNGIPVQTLDESETENGEDVCMIEKDPGPCLGHFTRWYFNKESMECMQFKYHGCKGNRNNFATKEKCMETCGRHQQEQEATPQPSGSWSSRYHDESDDRVISWVEGVHTDDELDQLAPKSFHDLDSMSLIKIQDEDDQTFRPVRRGRPPPRIDCQASAWSEWSECSKSCGTGWSTRTREILVQPGNGGKSCPKKLTRRKKCRPMPCPANTKYWYQGSWRHFTQED